MAKFLEIFATPLPDATEIPLWVWIALFIIAMVVFGWILGTEPNWLYRAYNDKAMEMMKRVYGFDALRKVGHCALSQELCHDEHSYLITTEPIDTENGTSAVAIRLIIDWHTDDGNIPGISKPIEYTGKELEDTLALVCLDSFRESERIGYAEDVLRRIVINTMINDLYDRRHSDIMGMSREKLAKNIKWVVGKVPEMNGIIVDNIEVLDVKEA